MFFYRLLLLPFETCYTLNWLSEIMTIFLNYLLTVKVKVTEIGDCLKMCIYCLFKVICLPFVVILSLHLVFVNIIKCSLNKNAFLLQNVSKVKVI